MTDHDDLLRLLWDLGEGQLAGDDAAHLKSLLKQDAASRKIYARFMSLAADLEWERAEGKLLRDLGRMAQVLESEDGKELSAVSNQPSAPAEIHVSPRSNSLMRWTSRHPLVPSFGITVAIFVALLLGLASIEVAQRIAGGGEKDAETRQPEGPTDSEYVAILNHRHNAVWLEGPPPSVSDPRLRVGRKLVLVSGLIEVKYYTGARVVIEGPAEFWVGATEPAERARGEGESGSLREANRGYLALGKLVARVEGKDAKGFTIDTPFARVEDLGTEFGVEVLNSGGAEVVVLAGEVDVVHEAADGLPASRVRLVEGQGATIDAGRFTKRERVDLRLIAYYRRRIVRHATLLRQADPIFANGDFQSPETGTDNLTNVTPDAWTAVEPVDVLQVQTGDGSVFGNSVYSSGDQFVYFNAAGRDPGGAVFQTFATVTGAQYTVSFQLGHMFNLNAGGVAGILGEVFDGAATSGTALGSLTDTRAPIGENALVSFEFTAASGTSTVVFTDVSTGEDNIDTGLDNVSVRHVEADEVIREEPRPDVDVSIDSPQPTKRR